MAGHDEKQEKYIDGYKFWFDHYFYIKAGALLAHKTVTNVKGSC